jgi:integrase
VLVSMLAYAGLRPGEARELRWGHVLDELDGQPQVSAEDAIRAARASDVRVAFAG